MWTRVEILVQKAVKGVEAVKKSPGGITVRV
jgi:hypothetical protein